MVNFAYWEILQQVITTVLRKMRLQSLYKYDLLKSLIHSKNDS